VKKLPEEFLQSLEGVVGFNRETFVRVHDEGNQVTSIRINPAKIVKRETSNVKEQPIPENDYFTQNENSEQSFKKNEEAFHDSRFTFDAPVPWSSLGYYLDQRPSFTFDPLFHAGCYYVQEASGMFLEQAFVQLADTSEPLKVLDLCAAPGGKSTHILSLISPESILVSNEVISSRTNILTDNMIRWGTSNVVVTNNDPSAFSRLESYFDVMLVDAPCSGSGLFRKDPEAIDEWSLNNVQLCSQRQQRILADALPALKPGGLLIYSTCSYSGEEDECIASWLVEHMNMENLELKVDPSWNIVTAKNKDAVGYRFYPDKLKGEGLYMACFKKNDGDVRRLRSEKIEKASAVDKSIISGYMKEADMEIIKENNDFMAMPPLLFREYGTLKSALNIRYRGTHIGSIMKNRLVPQHSLALSVNVSPGLPAFDVNYDEAIKYLQRQETGLDFSGKGWHLIRYQTHNLGWVNVLGNRINNYYPKELRILKQSGHSTF